MKQLCSKALVDYSMYIPKDIKEIAPVLLDSFKATVKHFRGSKDLINSNPISLLLDGSLNLKSIEAMLLTVDNIQVGLFLYTYSNTKLQIHLVHVLEHFQSLGIAGTAFEYLLEKYDPTEVETFALPGDRKYKNFCENYGLLANKLLMKRFY